MLGSVSHSCCSIDLIPVVRAYREHGYRMREIAAHLGVHYATNLSRESLLSRDPHRKGLGPIVQGR
jgi:hypothetical protein